MRRVIALVFFWTTASIIFSQSTSNNHLLRRVRISTDNVTALGYQLESDHFDVIGSMDSSSLDVIVNLDELGQLRERGFIVKEIRTGRPLKDRISKPTKTPTLPTGYQSLDQIIQQMHDTAADYPTIAKVLDLTEEYDTPTTFEGRHLYIIKISDNVADDEDEPDILIVSNHHAREVVTPVIALHAIEQFTSQYGIDPRITAAVDNYEIWIAPVWNPDGYDYVYNVDDYWRKNRHVFDEGVGVDLNRNYPHLWSSPHSGSFNVNSNTFKGYSPASEAETKTMIALALDQRFTKLLDYHSRGREVLWGYAEAPHPFDTWLWNEAIDLSEASGYFGSNRRPSADGENYQWHLAKTGTYANLVETHTQFAPSYASAQSEARTVWRGILWDIEHPIFLSGHVTDSDSGDPVAAKIDLVGIKFYEGETNASGGPYGRYHIFAPTGDYTIRFSADGYTPSEQDVTITNEAQILDIQLSNATDVATTPEQSHTPDDMILLGNYPNPFNPVTTIHYRLSEPGHVRLIIFDQTGRQITTLVNANETAGLHSVVWDGTDASGRPVLDGLYVSRMTHTTTRRTTSCAHKMLLIK